MTFLTVLDSLSRRKEMAGSMSHDTSCLTTPGATLSLGQALEWSVHRPSLSLPDPEVSIFITLELGSVLHCSGCSTLGLDFKALCYLPAVPPSYLLAACIKQLPAWVSSGGGGSQPGTLCLVSYWGTTHSGHSLEFEVRQC